MVQDFSSYQTHLQVGYRGGSTLAKGVLNKVSVRGKRVSQIRFRTVGKACLIKCLINLIKFKLASTNEDRTAETCFDVPMFSMLKEYIALLV